MAAMWVSKKEGNHQRGLSKAYSNRTDSCRSVSPGYSPNRFHKIGCTDRTPPSDHYTHMLFLEEKKTSL